jgi:2-hydroxy-3-oxopropionate reductase
MTTVGFVGLGNMGRPMAMNLVKAGFDVVGFNRHPEPIQDLVGAGGRGASSTAEVTRDADIVITMLPDSPDVLQVALGEGGVVENARPGLLYIDMSTVKPSTAQQVAEAGKDRGVRVLDAPVSGGEQGAIEGTLSIMVGGDTADFEAARPVLEVVGRTIAHVGPHGAGQTVKAANQLLVAGIIELVGEALTLLSASGVDLDASIRVLSGGLAGNRILEQKAAKMLAHDFKPGFRVDLHLKDLAIVLATARDVGVALPVTGIVDQLMGAVRAQGGGSLDHGALLSVVEGLSGRRS